MRQIVNKTGMMKRRAQALRLLLVMALLTAVSAAVRAEDAVERFVACGAVDPDNCAVLVMDLADGKVIGSHNADKALVPASINKVVTIASLLEKSGIDYRYETKVYAGGRISDGVLEGNLVVVGGGDPSLGANVEPKGTDIIGEIVDALHEKGVTRIAGEIETDESIFSGPATPPSWQAGDLRQAYGTGCHGLNYCRNASGGASVANPAGVFTSRLRTALSGAGISVDGNSDLPQGKRKLLLTHRSPSIDEIMRSCMMRSDNLYAETFMRTLALLNGKEGSTTAGAAAETDFWRRKRFPVDDITVVDGSGLSRSNRMTADFMAQVLRYMADNVDFASFFPLAGQEGTLRNFLKNTPLDSYIALKTGSMNGIQCYAGYLLDDNYAPTHVVVVMVNGFRGSRAAVKKGVADMLLEMFAGDQTDKTE